jgi:hypothetical protein
MLPAEVQVLNHWSFVNFFNTNKTVYREIYERALRSLQKTPANPTDSALSSIIYSILITQPSFRNYCNSKCSYNPNWIMHCAESFSRYIVSAFYGT